MICVGFSMKNFGFGFVVLFESMKDKIKMSRDSMQFHFVGVLCLDEILDIEEYPKEDSKIRAQNKCLRRGGSATNAAVNFRTLLNQHKLQKLNDKVYLHAVVADDNEGRYLVESCRKAQVEPGTVTIKQTGSTPKSTILRTKSTRTIIHYRDLDELGFVDFETSSNLVGHVEGQKWFHFEGRNTEETLKMMQHVAASKNAQCLISLELERTRTKNEHMLLAVSPHLVVFSHAFMESFGFENVETFANDFLLKSNGLGPSKQPTNPDGQSFWIFTFGERGSIGLIVDQHCIQKHIFCPAKKIESPVDSVGAGDAFLAALIFGRMHLSLELEPLLKFATDYVADRITGRIHLVDDEQ